MPELFYMAGDEGFEPPITGPEPVALPLGQSPICWLTVIDYSVPRGYFLEMSGYKTRAIFIHLSICYHERT